MLVQPYVVAFMIMRSQDVLFVSFDGIFVYARVQRAGMPLGCTDGGFGHDHGQKA